jgi:hypothetical protein
MYKVKEAGGGDASGVSYVRTSTLPYVLTYAPSDVRISLNADNPNIRITLISVIRTFR